MPNLAGVLKEEIRRLARKEIRAELAALKKASAQRRRDVAALRRQVAAQDRKIASLERIKSGRAASSGASSSDSDLRFSVKGLRSHRNKLGLSAADYAALVGVSQLTIYNWEKGRSRPRRAQLEALATVRGLGKREAWRRLEEME